MKTLHLLLLCFLTVYSLNNISALGIECFESQSVNLYCTDGNQTLRLNNFTLGELTPEEKRMIFNYIDLLFYGSISILFILLVSYLIIRRVRKRH